MKIIFTTGLGFVTTLGIFIGGVAGGTVAAAYYTTSYFGTKYILAKVLR